MLTAPKVIDDKTYMTAEGFKRRETTILHPPELEDLSKHSGPVLPIHFDEHGRSTEFPLAIQTSKSIPASLVPPRKTSVRKPVGSAPKNEMGNSNIR